MELPSKVTLSVVTPCFNEATGISELYGRLTDVCRAEVGDDYEFVFVDDGSTDGTRDAITKIADADPHVVGVILSRNHGHQLALSAGLQICSGRRILIIDADLQDPPELLPQMMAKMDNGADVIYGRRTQRQGESFFKKTTAGVFYRILRRLVDIDIPADAGDFRLMSRRALDQLNAMPEQHRFIRGMVSWIGFRQEAIDYTRNERFAGESKYPIRKMVSFAIDAITGFSIVPLKIATYLGFFCFFFGIFVMGYTLHSYLTGIAIPGWTTLISVVLILGSGQLLVLGVIGEYLGRVYMQGKNRPLYIIEDILRSPTSETVTVQKSPQSVDDL